MRWCSRRLWLLLRWDHLVGVAVFSTLVGAYLFAGYAAEGLAFFEQPLQEAQIRGLGWTWSSLSLTFAKPLIIWAVLLPWSVALPFLLIDRSWVRGQRLEHQLIRASGAFLVAGTLAFVATPTHHVRYYLPLCASVGILCSVTVARASWLQKPWRLHLGKAVLVVAIVAAGVTLLSGLALPPERVPLQNRVLLVCAGLGAAAMIRWLATDLDRHVTSVLLVAALSVVIVENLGYRPTRTWKRSLEDVATALRPLIPDSEPVFVLGPADLAGKACSLYFYLGNTAIAYRLGEEPPPVGSLLIFDTRERALIEAARGRKWPLVLSYLDEVEHTYSTYYLARAAAPP